jgi:hypothetical protein
LTEPLLAEFLEKSKDYDNDWGNQLYSRILGVDDRMPETPGCRPAGERPGVNRLGALGGSAGKGAACNVPISRGSGTWLRTLLTMLWPVTEVKASLARDYGDEGDDDEESRGDQVPAVWSLTIDDRHAGGVVGCLQEDLDVRVQHLSMDPHSRTSCMRCLPLMLKRADSKVLLPKPEFRLAIGDQLLFCGGYGLERRMAWMLKDPHGFRYLVTGETEPVSSLGRWLARRKTKNERNEREGSDGLSDSET